MLLSPLSLLLLALLAADSSQALPDSGLQNVSEVVWSGAETARRYVGSPSIARCSNGSLLVTHDWFGAGVPAGPAKTAFAFRSDDGGASWRAAGAATPMYWATLFTRARDSRVYLLGTTNDGDPGPTQIAVAASADCGATWATRTLTASSISYSTGPTPVLAHAGRLWRAFELNSGVGWASGYASLVLSAPDDPAADLLDPRTWTVSQPLPFASVRALVPAAWSSPSVFSSFGWLEGNAVQPANASDPGISILLRVNSLPAANAAALLHLAAPDAAPQFVGFVEFPGGMSKFTVRRDPVTSLYLTLSNAVQDASITLPPACGPAKAPEVRLPSCSMDQLRVCGSDGAVHCLWTHGMARDNLTLAVSADLQHWTVVATVMQSDTGLPEWLRQIFEGFQYVDFQLDGDDLVAAVRAAYRGADCYHNSNRILFQRLVQWRRWLPKPRA